MQNINRQQDDYWLDKDNCLFNSYYNTFYLKNSKNHKVRCGAVFFNGKQLYGGDTTVSTRKFNLENSHWWVELDGGLGIIDWVINDVSGRRDMRCWEKASVERKGFKWVYYDNEKGIEKKIRKYGGKWY